MLTPRTAALAALALALLLPAARAADVDPYAPADSEWVLRLNLKQLADAPAVKKHAADAVRDGLTGSFEALKPLAALGIDPLKDVTSVTAAGSGLLQYDKAVLIVRGLDADKLGKKAAELVKSQPAVWKAHKSGDVTVYEVRDKARMGSLYVALLKDGTALASASSKIVATAVAADPKKPAKVSKELQGLVAKADEKDTMWLASVVPASLKATLAKQPQTAGVLKDMQAITARMQVGDDVKATFTVRVKDKKSAQELADLLDNAKGIAAAAAFNVDGVGPVLGNLLQDAKASAADTAATLTGEMSEEQIVKALKKK